MHKENSEYLLLNFCNSIQDLIFVLDSSGNIIFSNDSFDNLTKNSKESDKISCWLEPNQADTLLKKLNESIQKKKGSKHSIQQGNKWYNLSIHPLITNDDVTNQAIILAYDYTDHIEREMKLNDLAEELELSRDVIQDNAGELAKAYDQLEFSRQELERFSKKLEEQNKLLFESDEKQRVLNAQKDKFVSIISHDLRAPFTSILGYSDALLTAWEGVTEEEKIDFIGIINKAAKSQLELLDTLLHWSRLETNKVTVRPEVLNMFQFVENCIMNLSGIAQQKEITLVNEISQNISVIGDHLLLSQVIQNLISNALKFTKAGGSITVSLAGEKEPDRYIINISDNGIGMPEHIRSKLFRIDSKVSRKGTSGEAGTGLGLLVCKQVVDLHNGEIWVESTEGKGTTFSFTIPKAYPNILVIAGDDEKYNLFETIINANHKDYKISRANNLNEAGGLLQYPKFAVIIYTQANEKKEYDSFFELINHDANIKLIPTVITTSITDQEILESFLSGGADLALPEPLDKNHVTDGLAKILLGIMQDEH